MKKKSFTTLQVIVIAVLSVAGFWVGKYGYEYYAAENIQPSAQDTIDAELSQTISELNKQLPVNLDAATRLDNMSTLPGRHVIYFYTITDVAGMNITADYILKNVKPRSINYFKTSQDMKHFRDIGAKLTYMYRSEDGSEITSYSITPDDF